MKFIDKEHPDKGKILFPDDSDKFNELLDYLFLDDKKDLGDTFGTTGGGISVPVLGRLLCKRPFFDVLRLSCTKFMSFLTKALNFFELKFSIKLPRLSLNST